MTNIRNALIQSAGSAGGDKVYVEDVFSTDLYTGNNSTKTITNGIDLSGEGGLVWTKNRPTGYSHSLIDTVRGTKSDLRSGGSDEANNTLSATAGFSSFNSDGYSIAGPWGAWGSLNTTEDHVSWTFRKQTGFFDCVTFSTTGGGGTQAVSHSLGSEPGLIIIKKTSAAQSWLVWKKDITQAQCNNGSTTWWRNYGVLNATSAFTDWGDTSGLASEPSSTAVTLGTYYTNATADYVMYVFAEGGSDDQIFGEDGDEAIVKCGTWTASSGNGTVTLGFEPQWVIVKCASGTGSWLMFDNMRGMSIGTDDAYLVANSNGAEGTGTDFININATGFTVSNLGTSEAFIYMAIRRGPMKEPEAGTDVFSIAQPTTTAPLYKTGKLVDMAFNRQVHSAADLYLQTRLAAKQFLRTNTTDAAQSDSSAVFDYQTGYYNGSWNDTNAYGWAFRRFPKVFDVIARTGTGGGGVSVPHNLTVVPELVISKTLTASGFGTDLDKWFVWSSAISGSGNDTFVQLQSDTGGSGLQMGFFSSSPTASAMTVHGNINYSGDDLTYFLFASLSGISAVNKYTGTGNDINVTDLGAAARFVMIKRTDNTGDWYVYDSTRGIVSGNDPYIFMNTQAAQVTNTDYIDAHASGFTITSSAPDALNASGGEYLYLAFS